jgi:hypothetical protein
LAMRSTMRCWAADEMVGVVGEVIGAYWAFRKRDPAGGDPPGLSGFLVR